MPRTMSPTWAGPLPEFATIRAEGDGLVGRLTLARPDRLNVLGTAMLAELATAARWFDELTDVRVVIVSGEGRAFCAGFDLDDLGEPRQGAELGRAMSDAVAGMRAVTIAAMRGHVVGGGVVLAAACDLRLAAERTSFSIPEVDLGIPLAWGGVPLLLREIGPARTKELVMTCRPFDAAEAKEMGFVNRVVPGDQLITEAVRLAAELAAKPSLPISQTKEHVDREATGDRSFDEVAALLEAMASPESQAAAEEYVRRVFGD